MWETKQLMVAVDFHSMRKNAIEVSGYCQLFTVNNMSKQWQHLYFLVSYLIIIALYTV